jgi:hypothetical protein
MARGWESKSIEDQQAQAAEKSSNPGPHFTPEQASRQRHRDGLLLSRQRMVQQLASTTDARKRDVWQQALKSLNEQLAKLAE